MKTAPRTFLSLLALLALVVACGGEKKGDGTSAATETKVVKIGATTSLRDSGLFEVLKPAFEKSHPGAELVVLAKGTGAAMKDAEAGHVDILVVHSPAREKAFLEAGHGLARLPLMESGFLLVGPKDDPAKIRGKTPDEALRAIAASGARFLSRGDDSGTHDRERSVWKAAGGNPGFEGYIESGRGMGATVTMANEMNGYTLIDTGTFANFKPKIELEILVSDHSLLANPYHVITLPVAKRPLEKDPIVDELAAWLTGPEARAIIAGYQINGVPIFTPGVQGE
ncbi:MAG: substrate-binding domain-containing protein [Planctomycetota bacterium]